MRGLSHLRGVVPLSERDVGEILQRLSRLEGKLDIMLEDREVIAQAMATANEALQSSKSAHHRIDEVKSDVSWAWRTAVGAVIGAIISFIIRFWER